MIRVLSPKSHNSIIHNILKKLNDNNKGMQHDFLKKPKTNANYNQTTYNSDVQKSNKKATFWPLSMFNF